VADSLIENVSDTAFWIAHYRGLESERTDALFHDPLAFRLAGDHGRKIARAMPGAAFTSWAVVMRTCIIDDYIRFAITEGVDTVLNLGAGLDTRPYRMDLPSSLVWIEVDYPDIIAFKEERLQNESPRCRLSRLKRDLANKTEREQVLADANARAKKILVLTEGVVPYLSEEDVASLAGELKSLDRVAYWVVDYISPIASKYRPRQMKRKLQNAPFKFEPEDWSGFFERHGWRSKEMRYFADEADRLKRPLQFPLWIKLIWVVRAKFLSKQRRESFRKLAGYALLEPIKNGS
jgi:methyltransferase (TIGR00027 family)